MKFTKLNLGDIVSTGVSNCFRKLTGFSVPGVPVIPDTPDIPDIPDIPDVPDIPDTPDTPDVPIGNYLMFSSPSSFTLGVITNAKHWDGTLEYSTDTETWETWGGTSAISSSPIGQLYLRGTGNTIISEKDPNGFVGSWVFTSDDYIECHGNIENLLDYKTVASGEHPTMGSYCYLCMFAGCANLKTAPELPATTLVRGCYSNMFLNCTKLTTAPDLPATTLAEECYMRMFEGCDSLLFAPKLHATVLTAECCSRMFFDCPLISGDLDLSNVTVIDGLGSISSLYSPILIFGRKLDSIVADAFNTTLTGCGCGSISIRYEFTDDDEPKFNTEYVVSKGSAEESDPHGDGSGDNCGNGGHTYIKSYKVYTDNTAIKDGALSNADEYTQVAVFHLNGEVWE